MPSHKREPLVVYAFNAHNAPADRLRSLIRQWSRDGADVIVLNEVWTRRDALAGIAKTMGWTLHQEATPSSRPHATVVPEAGSTAVLVAPGVKVLNRRVIAMTQQWTVFSAKRRHMPRRFERLLLSKDGQRIKLTAIHGPTNGPTGGNSKASLEMLSAMSRWSEATQDSVVNLVVGDTNIKLGWLKGWARKHGAKVVGHNVDAALVTHGTVKRKVLSKYGSDHHAVRYEVRAK